MIATHKAGNYPHIRDIFTDLGQNMAGVSTFKQIDSLAFDGLILLGGPDVQPSLYGQQEKYPLLSRPNWQRDTIEWYLLKTALDRDVPVLGICRGMQMLNVVHDGTLWQDLRRDGVTDGQVNHKGYHNIFTRGPLMGKIPLAVNSRHHQAVDMVGLGLEPVAFSNDGVIEAIYRPGVLGVQWHPEDLYFEDSQWAGLFEWFLAGLRS